MRGGLGTAPQTIAVRDGIGAGWQIVVFVAALLAVFSRLPGALLHPQFFAEDGWVWYQQAYNLHWFRALAITQAGYLQMLPRLVAGVALLFPMQWAPLIMNLVGAVIQVLPVTALLSRRCSPWGPLPVRISMAVIYIAIPNAPEIHIVLTNAMWHLAVLQALLAFSLPPLGWVGRVADILLFTVGATTGPFCIPLLPLVLAYWLIRRQRWTLAVLGILLVGVVVQVFSLMHSVRNAAAAPLGVNVVRLLRIIAGNVFFNSMAGSGGGYLRIELLILIVLAGLAIPVWGWRCAPLAVRLYMAFAIMVLMASLKDPLLLVSSTPRWEVLAEAPGMRYWFLPSLMFLWAAAWCAWRGTRVARYAGIAVLLLMPIGVVRKWSFPPWPESDFRTQVERFNSLKTGEHMLFSVYDPGDRKMELIKR